MAFALQVPLLTPDQLLRRNVKRFRGELVFKAHRLLNRSTLGLKVVKTKEKMCHMCSTAGGGHARFHFGVQRQQEELEDFRET